MYRRTAVVLRRTAQRLVTIFHPYTEGSFMPTRDRYREYREDQTTIWVSKAARAFLDREKKHSRESTTSVVDRLLRELRGTRRGSKK